MNKEEFEEKYTKGAGVTLEFLHEHGYSAVPCDCDYEKCEGWKMEHVLYKELLPDG